MTTEKPLTNTASAGLPAPRRLVGDTGALGAAIGKAESFRAASKSAATVRAYASVWRAFTAWCEKRGVPSLPASPATVAAYLADRAEPESGRALRPSSLQVHAAAIAKAHKLAGMQSPLDNEHVRDALDGIRRRFGIAPKQKAAVRTEEVRRLMAVCANQATADFLREMEAALARAGTPEPLLRPGALHGLSETIYAQATMLGFRDAFVAVAVVFTIAMIPAFVLKRRGEG